MDLLSLAASAPAIRPAHGTLLPHTFRRFHDNTEPADDFSLFSVRLRKNNHGVFAHSLSVPGKTGIVTRANHVIVEAYNENMEKFTIEAEELMARALQHEIDHLDGVMYVDLVKEGELYNNEDLQTEE